MEEARQRWTQGRQFKQPSLYDEYLSEGRPTNRRSSHALQNNTEGGHTQTIRTVTPDFDDSDSDPATEGTRDHGKVQPPTTQASEREFLTMSPTPLSPARESPKELGSQIIASSPVVERRESSANARRQTPMSPNLVATRRRTMTLQETTSDHLAPSLTTGRTRMLSEQHSGHSSMADGHTLPSSVSQPALGMAASSRQGLRDRPSISGSISSPNGPLPTPNARRILHLMKTLCGKMSGNAYIRKTPQSPWTPAYCFIRESEGSLMYETEKGEDRSHKTLLPDLRGCQVRCVLDPDSQAPYIGVEVARASLEVHIRLASQSDLDSWFAALLCWQPMQPKGIQNRLAKPQAAQLSARSTNSEPRQNSEASLLKDAAVIKVGNMVYWDANVTFTPQAPPRSSSKGSANRNPSIGVSATYAARWWNRVSCTLRENGELKFRSADQGQHLATIQLSDLSRSAVQRLDPSVLEIEHCIAIYPQYTSGPSFSETSRPVFISLESSILFEVWFVLLRAFTIPQLYGPSPTEDVDSHTRGPSDSLDKLALQPHADMFRMERGLNLCVLEAKLHSPYRLKQSPDPSGSTSRHASTARPGKDGGVYVEIHLDGETRGKTLVKQSDTNPFWSQEFEYVDLPAVLSSASVYLKHRAGDSSGQKGPGTVSDAAGLAQDPANSTSSWGYTGISQDTTVGKVEIILEELDIQKRNESWWPIMNSSQQEIGSMLIRARAEETVILMRQEYEGLHELLHAFENGLTVQISQVVQGELKRLSDSLVNIFQVSSRSIDWLMALVEDEIDGLGKDTPLSKARYNQRLGSSGSEKGTGPRGNDRELVVRDMNKNAALEANLLFRGNTLLTKALDGHMRRIGAGYLTAALGTIIKSINERDPDCEVDPNKLGNQNDMDRNWKRLMATTGDVWNSIRSSAQLCPVELRFIFRHIKACAEDRYGDFLRTVSYSSVSGFLFLRFFCPAVLSPKLFGLLQDDPKPRAKRTFVLVAKSLQTMANMATFGSKEPWMERMNSFLNSNREDFKRFIVEVCYVPRPPAALAESVPAYSTPNQIRNRLPLTSKEGFPSLPFLLDQGREYANLVELWLRASSNANFDPTKYSSVSAIVQFDATCRAVAARTKECLARAERAERPSSELSMRWEEIVDSLHPSSGLDSALPTPRSQPPTPRIDTHIATSPLFPTTSNETPRGRASTDTDSIRGGLTPVAALPGSSPHRAYTPSPSSPHLRAQRDWASAPDGGAASAAASLLSQDRNPRAGFVLPAATAGRPDLLASSFARVSIDDLRNNNALHPVAAAWSIPQTPRPSGQSGGSPGPLHGPFSPALTGDSDPSRPGSALSGMSARSGKSGRSAGWSVFNGLGSSNGGGGSTRDWTARTGSEASFDGPSQTQAVGETALPVPHTHAHASTQPREKGTGRKLEKERKRPGSKGREESGHREGRGMRELLGVGSKKKR